MQTKEEKANQILNKLKQDPELSQFEDAPFPIPKTFKGVGELSSYFLARIQPSRTSKVALKSLQCSTLIAMGIYDVIWRECVRLWD